MIAITTNSSTSVKPRVPSVLRGSIRIAESVLAASAVRAQARSQLVACLRRRNARPANNPIAANIKPVGSGTPLLDDSAARAGVSCCPINRGIEQFDAIGGQIKKAKVGHEEKHPAAGRGRGTSSRPVPIQRGANLSRQNRVLIAIVCGA